MIAASQSADSLLVRASQVGYLPNEQKVVTVVGTATGPAVVRQVSDNRVVMTVPCRTPKLDVDSGVSLFSLDITKLRKSGQYRVEVPGVGVSDSFEIGPNVFADPLWMTMRSYLGQRCGMAVSLAPQFPQYHYDACHVGDGVFDKSSGKEGSKPTPGGWHDAGDYGRYVVNSGISTSTLMWAFEQNSKALSKLNLSLPDHNAKVPEFLTEVRWNLSWMMSMQDVDGGVWHKETTAHFSGFVMPDKDTQPSLIIGQQNEPHKVTAASADLAATCAVGYRVFKKYDAAYAKQCLTAAERAWKWAIANPKSLFTRNPAGIGTGGYGDENPADELLWASAELFRATGKAEYNEYFLKHVNDWKPYLSEKQIPGWPEMTAFAMLTYAMSEQKITDTETVKKIVADATRMCEVLTKRSEENGYLVPLSSLEYGWGSNGHVSNQALILEITSRLAGRPEFRQTAQNVLHYLFGRNTFATSFVTHVGVRYAMNPHHRPSGADGVKEPWPGLLVGGPNSDGKPLPARQWEDKQGNYKANEVAINWNAPLVFLLACETTERGVKSIRR